MGILEIGLTIWAWKQGWKTWALLPALIGVYLLIFIALVLYDSGAFKIYAPNISGFIFVDAVVITALIVMIAIPKEKSNIGNTTSFIGEAARPRVTNKNMTVSLPTVMAKLTLPNDGDIIINNCIKSIGRDDFVGLVPSSTLRYISRQHCWIRSDKGKYFIEDYHSANGTKINGINIRGKGLHSLNDGDKIDIAGIVVLTFWIL